MPVLDLLIRLVFAFVLDLQLLERLVLNALQARGAPSVLAHVILAVTVKLENRRLAVAARVLLLDLFQPFLRITADFRFRRVILIP